MFNEIQKSLLISARKIIEDCTNRFICCAITNAVQETGLGGVTYDMRYAEGVALKEQIEFGIDGYSSIELWLFSEVGVYPEDLAEYARESWGKYAFVGWKTPVSREEFENVCRMARLAWLDRALEMGVLM